jgi:hypothetical protein
VAASERSICANLEAVREENNERRQGSFVLAETDCDRLLFLAPRAHQRTPLRLSSLARCLNGEGRGGEGAEGERDKGRRARRTLSASAGARVEADGP